MRIPREEARGTRGTIAEMIDSIELHSVDDDQFAFAPTSDIIVNP